MSDVQLSSSAPPSPRPVPIRADTPEPSSARRKSFETEERPGMVFRLSGAAGVDEEESFADWLQRYRVGRAGPSDQTPAPPASIMAILDGRERLPEGFVDSVATSPGPSSPTNAAQLSDNSSERSATSLPSLHSLTAATLLDFYRRKGHFPAPPGPYEEERLRLAHKYGLDAPIRRKAIDRICSLAKRYFKTKSVVISLTFDDHQVLGAERGWGGEEPGMDVPPRPLTMSPAFCTHAMLASYRDPKAVFLVSDADSDWRFKKNPYTVGNGGGLSFYAAANVNLPVPESDRERSEDMPETLASGALCLIDSVPRAPEDFTEEDREVLTDMAAMISREFRLGFEQRRREQETAQSDFIGTFLHQALVMPSQPGDLKQEVSDSESTPSTPPTSTNSMPDPTSTASSSAPRRSSRRPRTAESARSTDRTSTAAAEKETLFATAARQLRELTHAGGAAIIDLRSFRPASSYSKDRGNFHHHAPTASSSSNPASALATPSLSNSTSPFDFSSRGGNANSAASPVPPSVSAMGGTASASSSAGGGNGTSVPPVRRESLNSQFWRSTGPQPSARGRVSLMGSDGDINWTDVFRRRRKKRSRMGKGDPEESAGSTAEETDADDSGSERREGQRLELAVQDTLRSYFESVPPTPEQCRLDASAFVLHGIIPAAKATASVCVPVFDVDSAPACLIVLTSGEKWFSFEPTDRRFASSVGAIIVGSLLRQRALEADRAKLAFVSQVSHELRTPCHGVNSQLELIREFASPKELVHLAPLIDAAETCIESLRDVLDDTLDFSKLTNVSAAEAADLARRAQVPSDLASLVENVLKSTWVRKQRTDLVNMDVRKAGAGGGNGEEEPKVSLVLEMEERKGGWDVMVDVGGLKRILLNLVGNALKFTEKGEVKLSMREVGVVPSSRSKEGRTRRLVSISVKDTGIGMAPEFLKSGAFVAFRQANPFAQGAGLGLSITEAILQRLGGKLDVWSQQGVGTNMTITIPFDFLPSADSANSPRPPSPPKATLPRIKRRVISEELATLLRSNPNHRTPQSDTRSLPSITPIEERDSMDFGQAVSATRAALFPAPSGPYIAEPPSLLKRTSSRTSRRTPVPKPVLAAPAGQEELVVEVAKLSLSASPAVVAASSPTIGSFADSPSEEQAKKPGGKVKVLCADDNTIARNILVKLFTGKGIDFAAAADGQEAVDLFEAGGGTFTLILMDVQMPRMDGIDASTAIRKLEAQQGWEPARIIALTGLSNESEMQKALGNDGPVDSWLVKGGKSLTVILGEVACQQEEFDARAATREKGKEGNVITLDDSSDEDVEQGAMEMDENDLPSLDQHFAASQAKKPPAKASTTNFSPSSRPRPLKNSPPERPRQYSSAQKLSKSAPAKQGPPPTAKSSQPSPDPKQPHLPRPSQSTHPRSSRPSSPSSIPRQNTSASGSRPNSNTPNTPLFRHHVPSSSSSAKPSNSGLKQKDIRVPVGLRTSDASLSARTAPSPHQQQNGQRSPLPSSASTPRPPPRQPAPPPPPRQQPALSDALSDDSYIEIVSSGPSRPSTAQSGSTAKTSKPASQVSSASSAARGASAAEVERERALREEKKRRIEEQNRRDEEQRNKRREEDERRRKEQEARRKREADEAAAKAERLRAEEEEKRARQAAAAEEQERQRRTAEEEERRRKEREEREREEREEREREEREEREKQEKQEMEREKREWAEQAARQEAARTEARRAEKQRKREEEEERRRRVEEERKDEKREQREERDRKRPKKEEREKQQAEQARKVPKEWEVTAKDGQEKIGKQQERLEKRRKRDAREKRDKEQLRARSDEAKDKHPPRPAFSPATSSCLPFGSKLPIVSAPLSAPSPRPSNSSSSRPFPSPAHRSPLSSVRPPPASSSSPAPVDSHPLRRQNEPSTAEVTPKRLSQNVIIDDEEEEPESEDDADEHVQVNGFARSSSSPEETRESLARRASDSGFARGSSASSAGLGATSGEALQAQSDEPFHGFAGEDSDDGEASPMEIDEEVRTGQAEGDEQGPSRSLNHKRSLVIADSEEEEGEEERVQVAPAPQAPRRARKSAQGHRSAVAAPGGPVQHVQPTLSTQNLSSLSSSPLPSVAALVRAPPPAGLAPPPRPLPPRARKSAGGAPPRPSPIQSRAASPQPVVEAVPAGPSKRFADASSATPGPKRRGLANGDIMQIAKKATLGGDIGSESSRALPATPSPGSAGLDRSLFLAVENDLEGESHTAEHSRQLDLFKQKQRNARSCDRQIAGPSYDMRDEFDTGIQDHINKKEKEVNKRKKRIKKELDKELKAAGMDADERAVKLEQVDERVTIDRRQYKDSFESMIMEANNAEYPDPTTRPTVRVLPATDLPYDAWSSPPFEFSYTNRIVYSSNILPQQAPGCGCKGDCSAPENRKTCLCLRRQIEASRTRGLDTSVARSNHKDFAWNEDGTLHEHVLKMNDLIVECNSKCGCGPGCRNKVVGAKKGVSVDIFWTGVRGWGVRLAFPETKEGDEEGMKKGPKRAVRKAREEPLVRKGQPLAIYAGELMKTSEASRRVELVYSLESVNRNYVYDLDAWLIGEELRDRAPPAVLDKVDTSHHLNASKSTATHAKKIDKSKKDDDEEDGTFTSIYSIDAFCVGNWCRFANHVCAGFNAVPRAVYVDDNNVARPLWAYLANDSIFPGQEITISYFGKDAEQDKKESQLSDKEWKEGADAEREKSEKSRRCYCGHKYCRGILFGTDEPLFYQTEQWQRANL
ncbi:hypothetical protein JCM8547_005459 [Rhodosporidiobolus lusitaniae]